MHSFDILEPWMNFFFLSDSSNTHETITHHLWNHRKWQVNRLTVYLWANWWEYIHPFEYSWELSQGIRYTNNSGKLYENELTPQIYILRGYFPSSYRAFYREFSRSYTHLWLTEKDQCREENTGTHRINTHLHRYTSWYPFREDSNTMRKTRWRLADTRTISRTWRTHSWERIRNYTRYGWYRDRKYGNERRTFQEDLSPNQDSHFLISSLWISILFSRHWQTSDMQRYPIRSQRINSRNVSIHFELLSERLLSRYASQSMSAMIQHRDLVSASVTSQRVRVSMRNAIFTTILISRIKTFSVKIGLIEILSMRWNRYTENSIYSSMRYSMDW